MPFHPCPGHFRRAALLALLLAAGAGVLAASSDEPAFLAENRAAMAKMMKGMEVQPSGDVDRDFVLMMVPHHQGAIDMARAELRYGRNERLRRLAQDIIAAQQREIAVMQAVLGQLPPAPAVSQPPAPSRMER